MLNSHQWIPWMAGCLLVAAADAATVSVSNGVYAGSYVRDCRSSTTLTAPDKCIEGTATFSGTIVEISESSYPGALRAGVLTSNSLARTSGIDVTGSTVEASGDAFQPPELRLGVFTSTSYARASTGVLSVQGYSWDGSGSPARSLSLAATFTGSNLVDGDLSATFNPEAVIWGNVIVFSLATPTFEVYESLTTDDTEPGVCYFGPSLLSNCLQGRADFQLEAEDFFGGNDSTATVDVTLQPGRHYFTWVYAAGIARFGAWLDARNRVATTWSDTTGLTPAPGEVVPITAVIEWLDALAGDVTGAGPGTAFADKIALAQTYYEIPDVQATCAVLTDFVNAVRAQAGRKNKLSFEQAAELTADANAIMEAIDCD